MEPLFSEKQLQDMSKENIITLIQAMHANYAQRGHPFRLSGTAIPFLTVRSTAIV